MVDIVIDKPIGNEPGEISSAMVKAQLAKAAGQPITVRLHSEGGSVFEGLAIFDAFRGYQGRKKCVVESAAFSMASAIVCAFDDREITTNGYIMLHNPSTDGDASHPVLESLRKRLVDIYSSGTRQSKQVIEKMMQAETFLDAGEALRNGFVTAISTATPRAVARFQSMVRNHSGFKACIVARLGSQQHMTATAKWKRAVSEAMVGGFNQHKAMLSVDRSHPGLRQQMIQEANNDRRTTNH